MAFKISNASYHYFLVIFCHSQGTNFCPGEEIANVTTHDQVNNTLAPILFHLGKDPGEKYPIGLVTD